MANDEDASVGDDAGSISSTPDTGSEVLGGTSQDEGGAETGQEPDYSTLEPSKFSEDEILDWASAQAKLDQQKAAGQGPVPVTPGQQATPPQTTPGQVPTPPVVDAESGFKAAIKSLATTHPAEAKQIRDEHYKLAAYNDLFNIQDARTLRGMFSSVQEADQARTAAADLLALDYALVNDPSGLIGHIASRNPQALETLSTNFGTAVFGYSPDLYRQTVAEPAVQTYLSFWANHAAQTNNEELKLAVQIVKDSEKQYWDGQQGDTRGYDRVLQSKLAQYEQQEEQRRVTSAQQFQETISSSYQQSLTNEVEAMITRSGASLNPQGRQEIANRVLSQIGETMRTDPFLQRRLALEIKSGPQDSNHKDRIIGYLLGRAKGLVGPATRDALEGMTQNLLSVQNARPQQVRQENPQRRVGGAPPGTQRKVAPTKPLSRAELYSMTPDQILEMYAED